MSYYADPAGMPVLSANGGGLTSPRPVISGPNTLGVCDGLVLSTALRFVSHFTALSLNHRIEIQQLQKLENLNLCPNLQTLNPQSSTLNPQIPNPKSQTLIAKP
jgi:hypothetical protein